MNQEVPTTYIQDKNLAEEMAYAEKSARDQITELNQQIAGLAMQADQAGVAAGQSYIDTLQANLNTGTQPITPETLTTPERKILAAKQAMAAKYNNLLNLKGENSLTPEDFTALEPTEENGKTVTTIIYNGKVALDLGKGNRSYDAVTKPGNSHTIEIDGKDYKTNGLTEAQYRAFINSLPEEERNQYDQTKIVLLPGEKVGADGFARFAGVLRGEVRVFGYHAVLVDSRIGFRPAVEVDLSEA